MRQLLNVSYCMKTLERVRSRFASSDTSKDRLSHHESIIRRWISHVTFWKLIFSLHFSTFNKPAAIDSNVERHISSFILELLMGGADDEKGFHYTQYQFQSIYPTRPKSYSPADERRNSHVLVFKTELNIVFV